MTSDQTPASTLLPAAEAKDSARSLAPMGHRAAAGFVWVTLQSVAGKLIGMGSQVLLAWLLTRENFALVAKAYTAIALPALLQEAGVREILVRRKAKFQQWSNPAFWLCVAFGIAATIAMLASIPLAQRGYVLNAPDGKDMVQKLARAKELGRLILLLACAAPLNSIATVPLAKLQGALRFRLLAVTGLLVVVATTILSVIFASLGFGPYSIIASVPIVAAMRLGWLWLWARPRIGCSPQLRRWRFLLGDSLPMFGARAIGTLITIGDYTVLAWFHNDDVLAVYYFGFNLSMQAVMLFSMNLDSVLFPVLAAMDVDRQRQRQAYIASMRALAIIGIPACLLQAALADCGIHAVFHPKWYPAVSVVTALSIGMAFRIVGWPSQNLIPAQGRFRTFLAMVACNTILFLTLVSTAALRFPSDHAATAVAIAAAVYFFAEGIIDPLVALRPFGGGWRDLRGIYAAPLVCGIASAAAAWTVGQLIPPMRGQHWLRLLAGTAAAAAVYFPLAWRLAPDTWNAVLSRFRSLIRR